MGSLCIQKIGVTSFCNSITLVRRGLRKWFLIKAVVWEMAGALCVAVVLLKAFALRPRIRKTALATCIGVTIPRLGKHVEIMRRLKPRFDFRLNCLYLKWFGIIRKASRFIKLYLTSRTYTLKCTK